MFRKLTLGVCILFVASSAFAANKEQERLENSGTVLQEVMDVPDNIPQELLEKAECIIVFPSVLKAAFVVGGSYGRGAMVCRTGEHFKGPWGSPAMYALEGGSIGFPTRRRSDRSRPPRHEREGRVLDFGQQS